MLDNLLNLAGWWVYGVRESEEGYAFTCAYPSFTPCPKEHEEALLHRFGRKQQRYLDLPMHGKRVALLVHRQRYRCTQCGTAFWQAVPDMDERRWMTTRLVQYIQRQTLRRTFESIAAEVGVDEKTVRTIFHDAVMTLKASRADRQRRTLMHDRYILLRRQAELSARDHLILNS